MKSIDTEYQCKSANHLLLDPQDISNLEVILKQNLNVHKKIGVWNSEGSKDGAIKISEWFLNLIDETKRIKPEIKIPV